MRQRYPHRANRRAREDNSRNSTRHRRSRTVAVWAARQPRLAPPCRCVLHAVETSGPGPGGARTRHTPVSRETRGAAVRTSAAAAASPRERVNRAAIIHGSAISRSAAMQSISIIAGSIWATVRTDPRITDTPGITVTGTGTGVLQAGLVLISVMDMDWAGVSGMESVLRMGMAVSMGPAGAGDWEVGTVTAADTAVTASTVTAPSAGDWVAGDWGR